MQETQNNQLEGSVPKSGVRAFLASKKNVGIALAVAAVLILIALSVSQGLVVAATVNGSPITRLSVMRELEARGGKEALDARIQKTLIDNALQSLGITVSEDEVDTEIKNIEAQVAQQGGTLAQALAQQGMTEAQFREQIMEQKKVEKALAGKIEVTDAEVDAYIKERKESLSPGETAEAHKADVKEQLRRSKMSEAAQQWIEELKAKANITYYVDYN